MDAALRHFNTFFMLKKKRNHLLSASSRRTERATHRFEKTYANVRVAFGDSANPIDRRRPGNDRRSKHGDRRGQRRDSGRDRRLGDRRRAPIA